MLNITNNFIPEYISTESYHHIESILIIALLWSFLYHCFAYLLGGPKDSVDYLHTRCRIICTLNGIITFILSGIDIFYAESNQDQRNTELQNAMLDIYIAYCVYDWITNYYYGLNCLDLMIHHGFVTFGLGTVALHGYGGHLYAVAIFVSEMSNVPMNIRIVLKTFKRRNTKLYEISEILYFLIYILGRTATSPWVIYQAIRKPNIHIITIMCSFVVGFQNFHVSGRMIKMLKEKVGQYNERKEKGVKLWWFEENPNIKKLEYLMEKEGRKVF